MMVYYLKKKSKKKMTGAVHGESTRYVLMSPILDSRFSIVNPSTHRSTEPTQRQSDQRAGLSTRTLL